MIRDMFFGWIFGFTIAFVLARYAARLLSGDALVTASIIIGTIVPNAVTYFYVVQMDNWKNRNKE